MDRDEALTLLAVVIALSAYLAAVRLALISRLGSSPRPRRPRWIKFNIALLLPADAALLLAGLCLAGELFWETLAGIRGWDWLLGRIAASKPGWLANTAVASFAFAAVWLTLLHLLLAGVSVAKVLAPGRAAAEETVPAPVPEFRPPPRSHQPPAPKGWLGRRLGWARGLFRGKSGEKEMPPKGKQR